MTPIQVAGAATDGLEVNDPLLAAHLSAREGREVRPADIP